LTSYHRNFQHAPVPGPFWDKGSGLDASPISLRPHHHRLEARGVQRFHLVIAANLKVAFVVNRKIANTAIGRDVASALAEFDVPVLPVALHQRVLYAESAAQGLAVFEVAPNSDAAREIVALVENINNQQRAAA
jgi:cellulose biosynthesis protein BcsQ